MKKFDINRFGRVLARLVLVRRRKIINLFLGFLIACFIYMILRVCNIFTWQASSTEQIQIDLMGSVDFALTILPAAFFIMGTFVINDLKSRQSRISEMMLPATNVEKFVARVVLVSIVFPLIVVAAFLTADVLQQIVSMLVNHGARASMTTIAIDFLQTTSSLSPLWVQLEAILLTNAFTILGGMFFRKTAWLKTIISLILILMIVAGLMAGIGFMLLAHTDYQLSIPNDFFGDITGNIICLALTILMYWAAYKLYTRLQVINNRLINITQSINERIKDYDFRK